jgi:hypothetical protein
LNLINFIDPSLKIFFEIDINVLGPVSVLLLHVALGWSVQIFKHISSTAVIRINNTHMVVLKIFRGSKKKTMKG